MSAQSTLWTGEVMFVPAEALLPKRLLAMYRRHGKKDGCYCGECMFLLRRDAGRRRVFKCVESDLGDSASAASDWRVSWQACGMWKERGE